MTNTSIDRPIKHIKRNRYRSETITLYLYALEVAPSAQLSCPLGSYFGKTQRVITYINVKMLRPLPHDHTTTGTVHLISPGSDDPCASVYSDILEYSSCSLFIYDKAGVDEAPRKYRTKSR